MRRFLLSLLSLGGGLLLSFLGFGLFWAGLSPYAQAGTGLLYFLLSFALARLEREPGPITFLPAAGALPLSLLLVQFRDRNDSHLLPALIVTTWLGGALLGAYLGRGRGSR